MPTEQTVAQRFLPAAQELFEYTRDLRRDFHRFPELAFHEVRTAGIVVRELKSLGLEVRTGIAETGVSALIEGSRPGPTLMLRFDMDALPIVEETGAVYCSQIPGVMHACGHDGHTAVGLTVARLLVEHRARMAGTVKLVFQPAEEGLGGAERMIGDGVLDEPRPDYALGLHIWNEKPLGWVGITPGPVMAAGDTFKIEMIGKGGHGALPHQAVDPLHAAAQFVVGLQSIVSRNVSPLHSAVVSITMIHGGDAANIIPAKVSMQGTIRTFVSGIRQIVIDRFKQILHGTAATYHCEATLEFDPPTPAVVNDPYVAGLVQDVARRALPNLLIDSDFRTMGSEDMALFLQQVPGCLFFLGSANSNRGLDASHHHPRFDFDEDVLPQAAALMAEAALGILD